MTPVPVLPEGGPQVRAGSVSSNTQALRVQPTARHSDSQAPGICIFKTLSRRPPCSPGWEVLGVEGALTSKFFLQQGCNLLEHRG